MFLLPSKFKENRLKHAQVYMKCWRRLNKHKMKLKVHISVMAWQIQLKFGMECALLGGTFHNKNDAVLFGHYRVTDAWKWHFTHLSVVCLHWLYLATWHAIECLDLVDKFLLENFTLSLLFLYFDDFQPIVLLDNLMLFLGNCSIRVYLARSWVSLHNSLAFTWISLYFC